MWDRMPWRTISTENSDLGNFDEAVFFGLEELDGNAYIFNKSNVGYNVEPVLPTSDGSVSTKKKKDLPILQPDVEIEPQQSKELTEEIETKKRKYKTIKELRAQKALLRKTGVEEKAAPVIIDIIEPSNFVEIEDLNWGPISMHQLLTTSLIGLGFAIPTPIQAAAIPMTIKGKCDIVGAAETGSGKTLAFGLPVIHSLLRNWEAISIENTRCPYALIIAPTRELAMQITKVLKEVCQPFAKQCKIEVVSVVGGMSEHKQRRLLGTHTRPAHIIVGTPGRLCELVQDEEIVVFQDMSRLRFLIVDEADRIMEEGHFPELHRLFSRIRDHEKLAEKGENPLVVYRKKQMGSYGEDYISPGAKNSKDGDDDDVENAEGDEDEDESLRELRLPVFENMPSEEDLERARQQPATAYDEDEEEQVEDDEHDGDNEVKHIGAGGAGAVVDAVMTKYKPRQRQTLLYSATAIGALVSGEWGGGGKASNKRKKAIKNVGGGAVKSLPEHLQQLLSIVGVKGNTHVVDVTGQGLARKAQQDAELKLAAAERQKKQAEVAAESKKEKQKKEKKASSTGTKEEQEEQRQADEYIRELNEAAAAAVKAGGAASGVTLPKGLTQQEARVPLEDKDVVTYHFVSQNPGRTLIFVNSIKTARRVDGLLRALGINCRAIHAQLQQRQRLRALESFKSAPIGVLVATDVAARGLDVPKVQSVLHYDVARSPQVYIHRSGRTARAGATGTAVSIVSPEDTVHHGSICNVLGVRNLAHFKPNLIMMPALRERVKLAKKIFTQSFVLSQKNKEQNWLEATSREAELAIDERMIEEIGDEDQRDELDGQAKRALDIMRAELRLLLNTPLPGETGAANNRHVNNAPIGGANKRRGLVVFAK